MKIIKEELPLYATPQILFLDISNEGIICSSNEILEEIEGEW